jgi:predicted DNA-binding transcriptional regulator YafY
MSQTERIFYIDREIRETGGVSVACVAARFEVCGRQVKRDIEYMRDRLGAPIVWSAARRRYEYSQAWDSLSGADEKSLLSLAFLKSILAQYAYIPVLSKELIALIEARMPTRYAAIADKVQYELPDLERIEDSVAFALCRALLEAVPLSIDYVDAKGARSARSILPVRLVNYSGKWYCAALDSKTGELRTFAVSRIAIAAPADAGPAGAAGQASEAPGSLESPALEPISKASLPSEEAIDSFLSSSYGIFKGEPIGRATLRFYGGAARAVREQLWHRDQKLSNATAPDGSPALDMSIPVHDWTELLGRALRCGANCEVIGPPEFRARWAEEIAKMRALAEKVDR